MRVAGVQGRKDGVVTKQGGNKVFDGNGMRGYCEHT